MIIFPKITVNQFADKLYFQSQILYFFQKTQYLFTFSRLTRPKK